VNVRRGDGLEFRWVLASVLLLTYVLASWYPFRLDRPFRADDVVIESDGAWRFSGRSLATAQRPPAWLSDAVGGGYLALRLEVRSDAPGQDGPARVLTVSQDVDQHDLVVGQDGEDLYVRIRRDGADARGEPAFRVPGALGPGRWRSVEVVMDDAVTLRVDDVIRGYLPETQPLERWDVGHRLSLGNEVSWDRGWAGAVRAASVRTPTGRTDLLTDELVTAWDDRWIVPARLSEETARSMGRQLATWSAHLVYSFVVVVALGRAWRSAALGRLVVTWVMFSGVLNLGKFVIDTRHPSAVTWALQLFGGLLGAWLVVHRDPEQRRPWATRGG
jgi:hypothetical protein